MGCSGRVTVERALHAVFKASASSSAEERDRQSSEIKALNFDVAKAFDEFAADERLSLKASTPIEQQQRTLPNGALSLQPPSLRVRTMPKQLISESVDIKTTPERLWAALTCADLTERYWGGMRIESDRVSGARIFYRRDGAITDVHVILEIERLRRLVYSFQPLVPEYVAEPPSKVTIEIEPSALSTRLDLLHSGLSPDSGLYRACRVGWPMILRNLKAMLEARVEPVERGALG